MPRYSRSFRQWSSERDALAWGRKGVLCLLGTLFAAALLQSAAAQQASQTAMSSEGSARQITWVLMNWPPFYMAKDDRSAQSLKQRGEGAAERMIAELIAHLPGYQHSFEVSNMQHVWAGFEAGRNYCYMSAARTPAHEKVAYLTPLTLAPMAALVVRSDRRAAMKLSEKTVSLKGLLTARKDLAGYMAEGRSYGQEIESFLGGGDYNVRRFPVREQFDLMRQLDLGRTDYIFEFPPVVEYAQRRTPFQHTFDVIPFDDLPPLMTVYVACTRNAWGRDVIADVAVAVKDAARGAVFRNALKRWLSPELLRLDGGDMDRFYDALAGGKLP
ncbi:MAG: TIGR02285 family protein [Burkholderiaceae bacterium]|nr:TIGR02285 family protein [Burkholderiaceae bacterium]